jgi:hypothetical protein
MRDMVSVVSISHQLTDCTRGMYPRDITMQEIPVSDEAMSEALLASFVTKLTSWTE